MKIGQKINLILINGAILVIFGSAIIINIFSSNQLRTINESFISKLNDSLSGEISTFLKGEEEVILSLASSTVFRDFLNVSESSNKYLIQKDIVELRLQRSIGSVSQIQELFILDRNGKIVASTNASNDGLDRSKDLYFIEGKKGVYIKSFYFSDITKTNSYGVSAPILDDQTRELLGIVVARMYPDNLYSIIGTAIGGTQTGEQFLVDSNHSLISTGRFSGIQDILSKKIETQNVKDCFSPSEIEKDINKVSKTNISQYYDYRNVTIIGAHHFIPESGWCLITKEDLSEVLNPSLYLTLIIVLVSLGSLGIFIPISYYSISKIVQSIDSLRKGVRSIESGNLDKKVAMETGDEIGELSKSFDQMVQFLKKSREDVDKKVEEQTKEIIEKQEYVSDQQKATLNLLKDVEEEKIKIDALLGSIGDGVIATDTDANVIFMNKSAEDMLGWKSDEVEGQNLYEFLSMVDEKGKAISTSKRPFNIALNSKKKFYSSVQSDYYYIRKNGEKFPVAVNTTPILLDNKLIGAIDAFRDITQEKSIDKAKTEFVSLASHQLKTPLAAINWHLEMLLDGQAGEVTPKQKKYLDETYKSGMRMVELVESLLDVARIDLGTFTINPELTNITEISDSILAELAPKINNKKQILEKNYDKQLPKINVDLKMMRAIFQNLLTNAVKYTPEGGKISLSVGREGKDVLIKVKDNGYGIPKKDQPRIFEKLFRADNVKVKESDGTGLGLYLIKSVLEQTGGKLWFESEENKGSTFYVSMPLTGMKPKNIKK